LPQVSTKTTGPGHVASRLLVQDSLVTGQPPLF